MSTNLVWANAFCPCYGVCVCCVLRHGIFLYFFQDHDHHIFCTYSLPDGPVKRCPLSSRPILGAPASSQYLGCFMSIVVSHRPHRPWAPDPTAVYADRSPLIGPCDGRLPDKLSITPVGKFLRFKKPVSDFLI